MSRPSNIVVATIKRNQRLRGPSSSEQQNDFQAEVIRDLTAFQQEWNNKIVPLTSKLPDGSADTTVNAFVNGLDGQTLYVNAEATATLSASRYFNSTKDRPNTVFEQFVNIFTYIDDQIGVLENAITAGAASGALTSTQKNRIGDNIFDNAIASSASSLDGKTQIQAGNILQIARDVYGATSPTLNSNGNAILSNSIRAMVDALLELHGGNWDDDIVLNHSAVSASDITTGTLGQHIVGPSSASPGGIDDTFIGSPANTVEDFNQLRRLLRELKGTGAYSTAITPDGTWTGVVPSPDSFVDLITLKGTVGRTTNNPWGYSYQDISDLVTVLEGIRDFTGQDTVGDATPTYGALNGFSQGNSLAIAIGALASGLNTATAYTTTVSGLLNNHVANNSNPHTVDLTQAATAGGEAPASQITITDVGGYFTSAYAEPAFQELALEDLALAAGIAGVSGLLITHSGSTTNPHNVTLTQASVAGGSAPATQIDVTDSGNHFTSATAETVLEEIGIELSNIKLIPQFINNNITVDATDSSLFIDATVTGLTVLLPDPTTLPVGRLLVLKKIDDSLNEITISGLISSTIDSDLTTVLSHQNDSIVLQPTASGYFAVANYSLGEERTVIKSTDTIRDNNDVMTADPDLQIPVVAGTYLVNSTVRLTVASDNPGLQLNFTTITDAGIAYMSTILSKYQPTALVGRVFDNGDYSNSGAGSGTEYVIELRGTIEFSSSEIFTMKWAQLTSHADDVTVKRGSTITMKRLQ